MMRKLLYSFLFFISKSLPKKLCTPSLRLLCVGMFFMFSFANAATITISSNTLWSNINTGTGTSGRPSNVDDIIVKNGARLTVDVSSGVCRTIQLGSSSNPNSGNGILFFNSGSQITVSGIITLGSGSRIGTITMTSGGNLITQGFYLSGSGTNVFTEGSGTVQLTATNNLPTTIFTKFNNLTISSGTTTLGTGLTINGNISIIGGGLSAGNNNLTITGNFTNAGTFNAGTATVTLNGNNNNQSFNVSNFNNLTLAGSGTKFFSGTTAVAGALVINSGVKADLGVVTHSANTLTLNGNQVAPTSWGSSSSPAQNKNDLYFTATAGQVNVGSSACTTFSSVTAITNVLFGSINNPTSASSTAPYIYYSNVPAASVSKGQYYELTVKGNTNGGVNSYYTAFFDWNGDGDFADVGEGPHKIGTINNSNGTDAKATSIYLQIPADATAGSTRMRIMSRRTTDYNTNSCAISGSTGQIQDYNITILEACVGNAPGNTLTTATPVCPNAPFTLSLQNTMAEGTSYVWQTSPDGNAPWTSATPTPKAFFSSAFATNQSANTNVGEISLYGNNTSISGGELFLTTLGTGYTGGFVIQKTPGSNINTFSASFDYKIYGGNGADGISLSYASNIADNVGGGESGEGSGIVLQLDTYDNEGVQAGSRVRITYNGSSIFNSAINAPFNLRTSSLRNVVMSVNDKGYLTLTIGGSVVVANLALPATYISSDKSNWKFKFSARTGDVNDYHVIDNVNIYYLDTANSKSTFTTTQTVKTYYRVAASCGGATVYSTPVMVDVRSAIINIMTSNACTGVPFSVTPADVTNGTIPANTKYTWTMPFLSAGLTGGAANAVAAADITGTLTNSTSTAQTAVYTVTPITGACTGAPFTLTVTVNPLPAPTITKNNDVSCSTLGSITLAGLPADWTITRTGVTTATQPYTGTTSTLSIQDLVADTYSFTVTNNAIGCTSSAATVTINDISSNTDWSATGWTNGEPDGSKSVTISSLAFGQPFTIAKPNVEACSLTIAVTSGDVIVPEGVTLTITNKVTSNDKLVFESGSSLLQKTNVQNDGDIVYKRKVDVRRFDLTYWSSPIKSTKPGGFKMKDLSPTTLADKFFTYSPTSGWATDMSGESEMKVGNGYSIRGPQEFNNDAPSTFTGAFKGVPNNGDIPVTSVVADKWFLFGNPYPSAIDVDELWDVNPDLGPLYFYIHASLPQKAPGDNTYRYSSNDYIVHSSSGSTSVGGKTFGGYIAAGQGFFAKPKGSSIHFNNDMRKGESSNGNFLKTAKSKSIERNRVWLNMVNAEGAFKQILVGYIEGATNNVDFNYDAPTIAGNSFIDFYSLNETKKLTIQGRALPFDNTDIVPLGYKTTAAGDFTIGIDHGDGFFNKQEIYLEDKTTGKTTNLRNENYTFSTLVGTFTDRFVLRYTGKTLGTDDLENLENSVLISVKNKTVSITCSKETIKEVTIFNVGAQLVYSKNKVNSSELQIANLHSSDQVLLVKVTLENGSTVTKKVIFSNL
ncbi:GEVED domain-containing protein [Flavobacterium humidisoli]|uniref:T9SS sorting signal type C domain-containing protein n=1 Tax=Flavobacterium humidisoli TaxID=2937442 RepID=A0ABY4LWG3_9FLAO|nr:GEVED domain-containing protein [Flavobacterium humidisoli]UPZ16559.1 T9SS sorting signal type C domain-containing protein [Flavobacterium humidisoli]